MPDAATGDTAGQGEKESKRSEKELGSPAGEQSPPGDSSVGETSPVSPEILEKLPPEARKKVMEFFAAGMYSGPAPNPVLAKITPQHITDLISLASKDSDHALEDTKHSRRLALYALTIVLISVLVVVLVLAFRNQNDLLIEVFKLLAVGLGGFGGGYGWARFRRPD